MKPLKPLTDQELQLAEAAARVIVKADEIGLPDRPDRLGITPRAFRALARAFVDLRGQVRDLHDLVDLTDPHDPIGAGLTKVGLSRRPADLTVDPEPRLVRTPAEIAALRIEDLITLYCEVMHEPATPWHVFAPHQRFVVRQWDGMDGCWTNCTADVGRDEALRVWAERTDGGTRRVSFDEIDYYRIFPAGTRMDWDGSEGREMFR